MNSIQNTITRRLKKPVDYFIVSLWHKHSFKIIVGVSVIIILYLSLHNESGGGTYSTDFANLSLPPEKQRIVITDSKGELECRRVLEKIFQTNFPKVRPNFLINEMTGKCLELDCYNEDIGLAVEYDGSFHYKFVKSFHKSYEDFQNQQYRDALKDRLCAEYGITLIRVPYTIPHQSIENFLRDKLRQHGYL